MSSELYSIDWLDSESLFAYANGGQTSSLWNGRRVTLQDVNLSKCRIGGINGVNTTFKEAVNHAEYVRSFTPGLAINWVYNRSNGLILDGLETFFLNYGGFSPNTAAQLLKNWNAFHEENQEDPDIKYLQICHSQGAVHVRNALADAPKKIRDHVIVVAIAPAVVIPDKSCFKSFNYASEKDVIPNIELVRLGIFDTSEFGVSKVLEMALEQREELIILPAHLEAVGIDHDFQSATYAKTIKDHMEDYVARKGVYK